MLCSDLRRMVAVALVFSTVLITMPVSAADFTTPRSVIGSVSAVGPVELRGVGISQEGTLFAGDRIRAGQKGYAKVLLGTGSKIEISEQTDVNVGRDTQGVKIAMNTGTLGFSAAAPLRIDVMPFEVTATDGATGHVAVMNGATAGIRAINGKVTVRNLKTSESFVLLKGQERLLNVSNGVHTPSLAELASNVPMPVPAPVPQAPAGRTSGGLAMDTGAWLAVIGGAAVAGLAIWGLIIALDNRDDIKDLKSTIDNLNNTITQGTAGQRAALVAISNAALLAANAGQIQATGNLTAAIAAQTEAALRAAGQTALAAQAQALAAQANAAAAQAATLGLQLSQLQSQIAAAGTASSAQLTQLNTLNTQLTAQRTALNNTITALNALLANPTVANTPGVPRTTISTVPTPTLASPA